MTAITTPHWRIYTPWHMGCLQPTTNTTTTTTRVLYYDQGWEGLFQRTTETENCTSLPDKLSRNESRETRSPNEYIPGGNKREKVSLLGAKSHCNIYFFYMNSVVLNPFFYIVVNFSDSLKGSLNRYVF